jgi:hypothetical protein
LIGAEFPANADECATRSTVGGTIKLDAVDVHAENYARRPSRSVSAKATADAGKDLMLIGVYALGEKLVQRSCVRSSACAGAETGSAHDKGQRERDGRELVPSRGERRYRRQPDENEDKRRERRVKENTDTNTGSEAYRRQRSGVPHAQRSANRVPKPEKWVLSELGARHLGVVVLQRSNVQRLAAKRADGFDGR